jgi:simple sugar transport system permease protein
VSLKTNEAKVEERAPPSQIELPFALQRYGLQIGTVGVALTLWAVFVIGAPGTFLSGGIYRALMATVPFTGIMALALTLLVVGREIDLSFGSVMAVGTLAFTATFNAVEFAPVALLGGLAAGLGAGLLNGLLVVKLGIPSLVATIGALFFWRGVVLIVTDGVGETTVHLRDGFVHTLLVGRLDVPVIGRVPGQMIWLIGLAVVLWFVLNRHRFGAHTYLVGDNAESARMMGVKTDRVRVMLFALMGVFAALAGIVATLEQNYFWPTVGEGALLPTVAIVFLGGTSIFGGTGTILGTVVAAFVIGAIEAGIVSIGLTGFYTQLIYGLIIVLSLAIQAQLRQRITR